LEPGRPRPGREFGFTRMEAVARTQGDPGGKARLVQSRVGELLIKQGLIGPTELATAQARAKETGGALTTAIVKHCGISEAELLAVLQEEYHLPVVDPAALDIPPEVIDVLPALLASKYHIVPVNLSRTTLTLAMADPSNLIAINEVKFLTGFDVRAAI